MQSTGRAVSRADATEVAQHSLLPCRGSVAGLRCYLIRATMSALQSKTLITLNSSEYWSILMNPHPLTVPNLASTEQSTKSP